MSDLTILYCGVDTLEANFSGELVAGLTDELELCKQRAQLLDRPEEFPIDGEPFFVHDKGQGKYAWVLSDWRMLVRVSRTTKPGFPVVSVKCRAAALASEGHQALWDQVQRVVAHLGTLVASSNSRMDLCCDVQGLDFDDADFANLVCPASYRAIHKDGDGVTYQLGKGYVVERIYRKDAEIKAKGKESYSKLWEGHPDYDPDAPVWRIEVQLRGPALKELNARSVPVAFSKLAKLWAYGMTWCELRVPTPDKTKKRWPVDLTWQLLKAAWGECAPEPRIRKAAKAESEERVLRRILGGAASLGAYSGKSGLVEVLIDALPQLERLMAERGESFDELVAVRAARLGAEEEVDFSV